MVKGAAPTKQMVPELVAEGSLEGALVCSQSHMLRWRVRALASKASFRAHRCVASLWFPLPVLCLPFNLLLLDAVAGSILDGASSGSFEASHPATTRDFSIPVNRWASLEQLAVEPSADSMWKRRGLEPCRARTDRSAATTLSHVCKASMGMETRFAPLLFSTGRLAPSSILRYTPRGGSQHPHPE